jgi:NtrC-family two-component system sensor histidine kinase KinB
MAIPRNQQPPHLEPTMISLRSKLWAGFGGQLIILLIITAISISVLNRNSEALDRVFKENYGSAVFCDAMKESLDDLNMRALELLWNPGQIQSPPDNELNRFETNLNRQIDNITLPGESELTQHLADLWKTYRLHYSQFNSNPTTQMYRDDLLPRYRDLDHVARQISNMNMSSMLSVDGEVKQMLAKVRKALLLLAASGLVLGAAFVGGTGAAILRSLRALTRSANEIQVGNLDHAVDVRSRDEIGQLGQAFNLMAAKLREYRKIDHERLQRTQKTTQLAIDSLPDAVFIIGPAETIEISNRTALEHFGIAPGATVSSLNLRWLNELYDKIVHRKQAIENDGYKSAIQLFDKGEERFLLPRAVLMAPDDGAILGVTVIMVDVTGLRRTDEIKSGLVSTVSHELRTPLTSMRMGILLLAQEKLGPLTVKQRQSLDVVKEDSDRLYRTIENLLNISRMEAGRAQFQFLPIDPREIVKQAVAGVQAGITEKKLRLQIELPEELPKVKADLASCVSALGNFLSNAIKYTPSGGIITVAARSEEGFVAFTVTDTGPGIPEQFREHLFEKFFRVPSAGGPSGAGLGLSIVKEIVNAHHGRVNFRSQPEGGSRFEFSLPRIPSPGTPGEG